MAKARIRRRWHPSLDDQSNHDGSPATSAKEPYKPWRVVLPVDGQRSPHVEFTTTWAGALAIAAWWIHPVGYLSSLTPRTSRIPNPITTDSESEHDDDL
jgi:hypothetical protein